MLRYLTASAAIAFACIAACGPASANSSFTQTCSEIAFAYSGASPTLKAVCLTDAGAPHATSLVLVGISDDHGFLTYKPGGAASTFQAYCGSIQITTAGTVVTLSAYCRSDTGFMSTSLSLNNINNTNGTLAYGNPFGNEYVVMAVLQDRYLVSYLVPGGTTVKLPASAAA